jgi:hypothetical protein
MLPTVVYIVLNVDLSKRALVLDVTIMKKPLGAKLKNAVSLMVILLVPIAQLCH